MSTPAVVRVSTGRPDGGQFAHSAQAEAIGVDLPAPGAQLPEWTDLEAKLSDALAEWTANLEDGDNEAEFGDLIGDGDEDAMIAAYGEGRSDYLCSLTFHADVDGWSNSGNRYEPGESGLRGRLEVMSGGHPISRSGFTHEDGPDISGLLDHCVTSAEGITTVHCERTDGRGPVKEIRNVSTDRLTDGPAGEAAFRSFDRDGKVLEETHMVDGVAHGPGVKHPRDGSTVRSFYSHGALTDSPGESPALKVTHRDGSTTRQHHPNGVWPALWRSTKPAG